MARIASIKATLNDAGGVRAVWEANPDFKIGASTDDQPRGRPDCAHSEERLFPFPGEQSGFDPAGQDGGLAGARSRLSDGSSRADQRHQTSDDDGWRQDCLRRRQHSDVFPIKKNA